MCKEVESFLYLKFEISSIHSACQPRLLRMNMQIERYKNVIPLSNVVHLLLSPPFHAPIYNKLKFISLLGPHFGFNYHIITTNTFRSIKIVYEENSRIVFVCVMDCYDEILIIIIILNYIIQN